MTQIESCSFCHKPSDDVKHLLAGDGVAICDACVQNCSQSLAEIDQSKNYRYSFELLFDFFGKNILESYITNKMDFSLNLRADLQVAIETELKNYHVKKIIGLSQKSFGDSDFTALLEKGNRATALGPLQYTDVDIGEETPVKCLDNGLWLIENSNQIMGLVLTIPSNHMGQNNIQLELVVPVGEKGVDLANQFTANINRSMKLSRSYRGKILSLDIDKIYFGNSRGVKVHKLKIVEAKDIILEEATLELLERNIINFVKNREKLKAFGMSSKKGVMFYGVPGTGKTHTIHYLANILKEHTTFLITADQMIHIGDYITLARLLQPSIVVIEDADLIARSRATMNSFDEESLLNKLLNEMDGLKEDADIIFILTTNRVEALENAISSRPGRIDQAIEFPLPNEESRMRLIQLYGRDLEVSGNLINDIAKKTEAMSAAFIAELMRRSAQFFIESKDKKIEISHVNSALDEMLFSGGKLNAQLLGYKNDLPE